MSDLSKTPRKRWHLAVAVLGVFLLIGLWFLRKSADGIRNALSLNYWIERKAGFDLYNPNEHYFKRGSRNVHAVLLTFDDAPHTSSTPELLAILKRKQVPATFFVIGRRVRERPDLVRDMIADGEEVGNHTQDHLRLDQLTAKQVHAEIRNCEINVQKAAGIKMTLLRPPGMRLNPVINEEISQMGYIVVGWNVGAKDFIPDQQVTDMTAEESSNLRATPDQITERVLKQVQDGDIILLHDNPVTAQALPSIIDTLKSRGYAFLTTSQMLANLPHPVTLVSNPHAPAAVALRAVKPSNVRTLKSR